MSFEKMQTVNKDVIHERSCIMLYYFTPAEIKQIQTVARMAGITETIVLGMEHGECTLQAILDNQIAVSSSQECLKQKAVIFNHISSARMNAFIEGLKKFRMNRPLIAVVTETSIKWTLKELLLQLQEEHHAVKNNQFNGH